MVVEFVDAEVGDRLATRDAELAFGFGLGGKSVAIPTETALDALAAHRAVARHCVFHETGQQVSVVRQPVGKRRAVVEDELALGTARVGARGARMLLDGCFERAVSFPKGEHALFDARQVGLRADRGILAHGRVRSRVARHAPARVTGRRRAASTARN